MEISFTQEESDASVSHAARNSVLCHSHLGKQQPFRAGQQTGPLGAVTERSNVVHTATPPPPSVKVLFSTLGSKSDAYDGSNGWLIAGPTNSYDDENQAIANPFTLSANSTIQGIQIALTYYGYGENSSYVAIFSDASGLPGTLLKAWKVSNLPTFGDCCTLPTIRDAAGFKVSGGVQYWLVAGTNGTSENGTVDVWNYTYNDSQGAIAFENAGTGNAWTAYTGNNAFALYGTTP